MFLPLEENPVFLEVPTYRVYDNLIHLNKYKAPGPDSLPNWVLKEYAELLAQPAVTDILNSSYKEQKLPSGLMRTLWVESLLRKFKYSNVGTKMETKI